MSFPRYPAYKISGVEWLAEVPAHWEVQSLKRVISGIESGTSVNSVDVPAADGEYGVLKTSCVYGGYFEPSENKRVVDEEIVRLTCPVRLQRLIVSRMNTPQLVGAAGIVQEESTHLFLPDRLWQVAIERVYPKFAYWWTQLSMIV